MRTTKEILAEIRFYRAQNRALYALIAEDKTIDLVANFYAWNEEKAKDWHKKVLSNDDQILALSRELCGLDV